MKRILIIQTAFIGDVILATPVIVALHEKYPTAEISMLVRRGNEILLNNNPMLHEVLIWDKGKSKYRNLLRLMSRVRENKYDAIFNLHRFATSGLITIFSGARIKTGFRKNPFSFGFTHRMPHNIGDGTHEIERNLSLVEEEPRLRRPQVFPSVADEQAIEQYLSAEYVCMAPASVWFTKQYHQQGWVDLCNAIAANRTIYLLGSPGDTEFCENIQRESTHPGISVLAGKLTLLQSAALMKKAKMNYVNDSAPLHLASAVNAPVRAIFCSTIPDFGFGPVSSDARIIEKKEELYCRPCGLHGYKACPEGHFRCAKEIKTSQFFE